MTEIEDIRRSYEAVADEYASRMFDELAGKPLDRHLLDRYAVDVRGKGRVYEVGCGPGHVARYLQERGVDVFGLDLSPRMVEIARILNPELQFEVGDMLALEAPSQSWAGAVSFYSLIHFTGTQLRQALDELGRVLRVGAPLLIGVHKGSEIRHVDEWWGRPVSLDGVFFEPEALKAKLNHAGFSVEELIVRPPYVGLEIETERLYVYARAGDADAAETVR
jgi:SAM-dependent methyltransferase